MAKPKKLTGEDRLRAELDNAQLAAGQLQREVNKLRRQTAPGLLQDATYALTWALAHPDFQPGGKYHQGALGTAFPVLQALHAALGPDVATKLKPEPLKVEQPAELPAAVQPQEQGQQGQPGGEQQTG